MTVSEFIRQLEIMKHEAANAMELALKDDTATWSQVIYQIKFFLINDIIELAEKIE